MSLCKVSWNEVTLNEDTWSCHDIWAYVELTQFQEEGMEVGKFHGCRRDWAAQAWQPERLPIEGFVVPFLTLTWSRSSSSPWWVSSTLSLDSLTFRRLLDHLPVRNILSSLSSVLRWGCTVQCPLWHQYVGELGSSNSLLNKLQDLVIHKCS